jgi:hypothetical protein
MDTCFCDVEDEFLNIIHMNFRLQMIKLVYRSARAQILDFITDHLLVFSVVFLNCFRKSWVGKYLQMD